MSISAHIIALEKQNKLQRYAPRSRAPMKRRLFLGSAALKDFNDPASAVNMLCGKGFIEASLTRWVTGGLVYGDAKKGRFLCRLAPPPPEIWEIRVTEPSVQGRLLGRFAEPDTLILLSFHTRKYLGSKGSTAWASAMGSCVNAWNSLFPGLSPFSGSTVHAYVTENCNVFPI